jgi:hypothetical protein
MLDKVELRVPFNAGFRAGFRFLSTEVRFEGVSTPKRPSKHYAGTSDLRPFGIDANLHMNSKMGKFRKSHKLEIIGTGRKSLRQMGELIQRVFEIDPDGLQVMRLDFASDLDGVTLAAAYSSVRVKYKRRASAIGELDYETVGGRRLEYFRYGKSPNCVRVYDKPAECLARYPSLLKAANPEAEPPTFKDLFGFEANAIRTRFERQAGARGVPKDLSTFGQLKNASDFDPFSRLEIVPESFPFPDLQSIGVARSLKLIGIHSLISRYGLQQARASLNLAGNAKRLIDDYREYVETSQADSCLTIDKILNSYRESVLKQIDGSVEQFVLGIDGIKPRNPKCAA